jgi:hypothetical protein
VGNSEVYQPPQTGKRLFTFRRFGGRLNNQLVQFVTALQHAKVLKRTLVVPNEVREVDWTGMFDTGFDVWDLDSLNAAYDIDWAAGLSKDFVTSIPTHCVLTRKEAKGMLEGGPTLWKAWDAKCPDVIDIDGSQGLLFCSFTFCGDSEAKLEAYKIYSRLKLSPSLSQHLASKRPEFTTGGFAELAVHSRMQFKNDRDEGVRKTEVMCSHGLADESERGQFCNKRTILGNVAVWEDFGYQIKSKHVLKSDQSDYRFVLASDGAHDWSVDFRNQFLAASNKDWCLALATQVQEDSDPQKLLQTMSVSAFAHKRLQGQHKFLPKVLQDIDGLSSTLLDLFSLIDSTYFVGGKIFYIAVMSSFTFALRLLNSYEIMLPYVVYYR